MTTMLMEHHKICGEANW